MGLTFLPPIWTMSLNILVFFWTAPLISSVGNLAQLVSPCAAIPAELHESHIVIAVGLDIPDYVSSPGAGAILGDITYR